MLIVKRGNLYKNYLPLMNKPLEEPNTNGKRFNQRRSFESNAAPARQKNKSVHTVYGILYPWKKAASNGAIYILKKEKKLRLLKSFWPDVKTGPRHFPFHQ